jgi:hypothetical protein
MQILARSGDWEIGILVIGLVYLQHKDKLYTYDSPYQAMSKVPDKDARVSLAKQLMGDK